MEQEYVYHCLCQDADIIVKDVLMKKLGLGGLGLEGKDLEGIVSEYRTQTSSGYLKVSSFFNGYLITLTDV